MKHPMPPRPSIAVPLRRLLEALVSAAPGALAGVDPDRVLIIAAAARKDAHASIRPLSFGGHPPRYVSDGQRLQKPKVVIDGREMLFEIALRPRFFLDTHPLERVSILAHELYHVDPERPGLLSEARRHVHASPGALDEATREIVESWRAKGAKAGEVVELRDELTLDAWRVRPPSRLLETHRDQRLYTEQHLYPAVVSFAG